MSVPVEASWLKEFFDVELVVYNNAGPGFTFRGGSATLALPDGLSLADTSGGQSLTSEVPIVYPGDGGAQSVSWLVRGDVAGEYDLSATYRASLEPTGLPISVTATTDEPLKVWGLDAIEYVIEVDDSLTRLSPYHLRVGMRNVADVPVYNARMSFAESDGTDFWYQPEQQLTFSTGEIAPGATFWTDDVIVIDNGTSPFSYVGRINALVGGLSNEDFVVTERPRSDSFALTAGAGETYVQLGWGPVDGATGYRIYRLVPGEAAFTGPIDTGFSGPDGTVPPNATTTLISQNDPDVEAVYVVSTLVDGRLVLLHDAVMVAPDNSPPRFTNDPPARARFEPKPGESESFTVQVIDGSDGPVDFDASVEGSSGTDPSLVDGLGLDCNRIDDRSYNCTLTPTVEMTVQLTVTATDKYGATSSRAFLVDTERQFTYVALGDSFSAGEGIEPFLRDRDGIEGQDNRCHRSTQAYPTLIQPGPYQDPLYKIASGGTGDDPVHHGNLGGLDKYGSDKNVRVAAGVKWVNWSCAGAITYNVLEDGQVSDGEVYDDLAQLAQTGVDRDADLVTISIGGNDMGFADRLQACAVAACLDDPVFEYEFRKDLESLETNLAEVLQEIQSDMWYPRVLLVGYPNLFPDGDDEQACSKLASPAPTVSFTGEMDRLNEMTDEVVVLMQRVAVANHVEFVDVRDEFAGHAVCGNSGEWINAATVAFWASIGEGQVYPPLLNDQSFHPNGPGQRAYAEAINEVLASPGGERWATASIKPGETISTRIDVPGAATSAMFASGWPGSDIVMSLVSPQGRIIDRDTSADDVFHVVGPTFETYEVFDPEGGIWTVLLYGADVELLGEPYVFQRDVRERDWRNRSARRAASASRNWPGIIPVGGSTVGRVRCRRFD